MSDTHSNNTVQVSEKRRKLLKASAITPLIATLPSGVAQANASAFQCIGGNFSVKHRCNKSGNASPNWVNGNSCESDNAVRKMLKVYYEPSQNSSGDWVCHTPLEAQLIYDTDTGLRYGEGHGGLYSNTNGYSLPAGYAATPALKTDGTPAELCYAGESEVLYMFEVSQDGTAAEVKGVWPEYITNDGYKPVAGSCLTSLVDKNALTGSGLL